jgi:NAD-dependent DNA ligase
VTTDELLALKQWIDFNRSHLKRPPFSEALNVIDNALADKKITAEELADIKFVCKSIVQTFEETDTTLKVQTLHGVVSGIASDKIINSEEWTYLIEWLKINKNLKGIWPFDEIKLLVAKHKSHKTISNDEMAIIVHFLNDFTGMNNNKALTHPLNEPLIPMTEINAEVPDIKIEGKTFCLTGESQKYKRSEIGDMITKKGGIFKNSVTKAVDYLIVCAEGSQHWKFSCYGRKVEEAMKLKKQNHHISIIGESDLLNKITSLP